MTVPGFSPEFSLDFTGERVDLNTRSIQRLLSQFQNSPVLINVLQAVVDEIQTVSDAIVDVMAQRTLSAAAGANLTTLGRIVGAERAGVLLDNVVLLDEQGSSILTENDEQIFVGSVQYVVDDTIFPAVIRSKITSNFNRYSSVPEITRAIKDVLGITVRIDRRGPMAVDIIVPQGTSDDILSFLTSTQDTNEVNGRTIFAYPVTLDARVVYDTFIITEDANVILTEDGVPIQSDNIQI